MNNKKFTPLMICHLVMMAVLALLSVAAAVIICNKAYALPGEGYATWKSAIYTTGTMSIIEIVALIVGILYLASGYSKSAAGFYKAFLTISALSAAVAIIPDVLSMQAGNVLDGAVIGSNGVNLTRILLHICEVVILLLLAFGKDLGKHRTWIFFGVLLALNVMISILSLFYAHSFLITLLHSLIHLLMTGTIGLAIKGKYDDKDARGTK